MTKKVTWEQFQEALKRQEGVARKEIDHRLGIGPEPERDPDQEAQDKQTFDQYCRQQGIDPDKEAEQARDVILSVLARIHERQKISRGYDK